MSLDRGSRHSRSHSLHAGNTQHLPLGIHVEKMNMNASKTELLCSQLRKQIWKQFRSLKGPRKKAKEKKAVGSNHSFSPSSS